MKKKCPGYLDTSAIRFCHQTKTVITKVRAVTQKASEPPENSKTLPSISKPAFYHKQTIPHTSELDSSVNDINLSYFLSSNQPHPFTPSQSSGLPQTVISGPMIRSQAFSSYLTKFFPYMTQESSIDMSQFVITGICMLPNKSLMLEKACSALSCVFLGKIYHNEQILQHGLQLYNHAIKYMSNAMSRNNYTDDIVYTCVIFQQIQTHHCPNGLGTWLAHIDGLGAMRKYYGQKTPTSPLIAAIFGHHQKLKVVLAEFMHLSDKTKAWLEEPSEGGPLSKIIDLLAEVSRIAAAIDTTNVSDHDACQSLLKDCLELEKNHTDVYIQFDILEEPPTYARGELKTGIPSTDDLFGPTYRFSSLNNAIFYIMLWLSLSSVYPLLYRCQCLAMVDVPSCLKREGCSAEDEAHRLSILYVSKAARCLPYCGQEGMNSWGILYGVLCAIQASRVYTHAKDYKRFLWAQDLFTYMELSGFDYAARFHDIWWNYWSETHRHDACRVLNYRMWEQERRGFSKKDFGDVTRLDLVCQ